MYQEDFDNAFSQEKSGDDIYSRPVRAGKSKVEKDGRFSYDKHKIFLYKEDFEKFAQGLEEVVQFIKEKCPVQERVYSEPSETPQFHNSSDEGTNDFTNVDFDKL